MVLKNKSAVRHNPKLNTIQMVEDYIEENSGKYKKRALWENLPRGVEYPTFTTIIEHLIKSNKIVVDKEGYIVWIWNPELVKQLLLRDDLIIK